MRKYLSFLPIIGVLFISYWFNYVFETNDGDERMIRLVIWVVLTLIINILFSLAYILPIIM